MEARQDQLSALQTAETKLARARELLQRLAAGAGEAGAGEAGAGEAGTGEVDITPADWQTVLTRCQVS